MTITAVRAVLLLALVFAFVVSRPRHADASALTTSAPAVTAPICPAVVSSQRYEVYNPAGTRSEYRVRLSPRANVSKVRLAWPGGDTWYDTARFCSRGLCAFVLPDGAPFGSQFPFTLETSGPDGSCAATRVL
jgi:hypothetical protein